MRIERIKKKYPQLQKKRQFVDLLAKDLGKSSNYLRTHWFNLWSIPDEHQERVEKLLNGVIELQKDFDQKYQDLIN